MILSFKNVGTQDIFNGKNTRRARRICPEQLWKLARRKLDQVDSAGKIEDFWLNLQLRWELYRAMNKEKDVLRRIKPWF